MTYQIFAKFQFFGTFLKNERVIFPESQEIT
jgi:hypothetical protein